MREKKPVRALHVDGDSCSLNITKQCLEMTAPVQVERAASVQEAIAKLRTEKYDVIVSDYQKSAKDGLELLQERAL